MRLIKWKLQQIYTTKNTDTELVQTSCKQTTEQKQIATKTKSEEGEI